MEFNKFLNFCWTEYLKRTPSAKKIFDGLMKLEENIVNDHLAFRTFVHEGITARDFATYFEEQGMEIKGTYEFPQKKVKALHLESPDNIEFPKIFISELDPSDLPPEGEKIVRDLLSQMKEVGSLPELVAASRPWSISYEDYEKLYEMSEYAAWLAAYGFFPNHFTVSLNDLVHFRSLEDFNKWLVDQGFNLNDAGGAIKGTPEVLLEQSSIMADVGPVEFSDGIHSVPTCYFEFARRYPDNEGKTYQGFIAASADKIFESTHTRKE